MLRRVIRGAAIAGVASYVLYELGRGSRTGLPHRERARALPGDDLVDAANFVATDAVTIDAPSSAVWPWLVQMGYARAGWYCCARCNRVDLEPHEEWRVLPQFQALQPGDVLPVYAGGGLKVTAVEPERTLVLHGDTVMAREHAIVYDNGVGHASDGGGPILVPEFAVSWAFFLEPLRGARTRLIARYRAALAPAARSHRLLQPVTGLGIFWLQRKQLRGIKLRAEYAHRKQMKGARAGLAA
jgi:proline iminopeptidase